MHLCQQLAETQRKTVSRLSGYCDTLAITLSCHTWHSHAARLHDDVRELIYNFHVIILRCTVTWNADFQLCAA